MMDAFRRRSKLRFLMILSLLSVISIIMIMVSTKTYSVGTTRDSLNYFRIAEQVKNHETISFIEWPPFYPILLAIVSALSGYELLDSSRLLNAVLFGMTVFMSGLLYIKHLKTPLFYFFLAIMMVIVSIPIFPLFLMAYSEPPFIFFTTIFLFSFDNYLDSKKRIHLILAAVSAALCSFTRYTGIVISLVGVLIIFRIYRRDLRLFLRNSLLFSSLSIFPIFIWLTRNYFLFGSFTGSRQESSYSFINNFRTMVNDIAGWFIPGRIAMHPTLFPVILVIIAIAGAYYCFLFRKNNSDLNWQHLFGIYMLTYLFFLIVSSTTMFSQLIDNRYLAPIFIPLNFLIFYHLFEFASAWQSRIDSKIPHIVLIKLIGLFLLYPVTRTRKTILNHMAQGTGYTSKLWRESDTIQYLSLKNLDCTIYSNGWDAINFLTDRNVKRAPSNDGNNSQTASIELLKGKWPEEDQVCVVWFDHIDREYLFSPQQLSEITYLNRKIRLSDGDIYFLSKKYY